MLATVVKIISWQSTHTKGKLLWPILFTAVFQSSSSFSFTHIQCFNLTKTLGKKFATNTIFMPQCTKH